MAAKIEAELLLPGNVDLLLRYPPGRSEALARDGRLPHIILPCGEIRFRNQDIRRIMMGLPAREVRNEN